MLPVLQAAALWLGLVVALGLAAARDAAAAGCADADAANARKRKRARKSVGMRANIVSMGVGAGKRVSGGCCSVDRKSAWGLLGSWGNR